MKAFIGGAFRFAGFCGLSFLIGLAAVPSGNAQTPAPIFKRIDLLTNRDISLTVTGKTGLPHRLEFSTNLVEWQNWTTFVVPPSGSLQQTDTAAAFLPGRYFRLSQRAETNLLTGDHIQTGDGDLVIHPVNHASFVMQWKDLVIYNDPVGGAAPYKGLPRPDLILVSHDHGDHFDSNT
ncbi:MAG TPA: MBL fold metallo-hydrolase, partial [Verrucomicrobiae bacterium]|nr:MBL fold metallo-hydrolase [Verrucomicrobiae bacterium]